MERPRTAFRYLMNNRDKIITSLNKIASLTNASYRIGEDGILYFFNGKIIWDQREKEGPTEAPVDENNSWYDTRGLRNSIRKTPKFDQGKKTLLTIINYINKKVERTEDSSHAEKIVNDLETLIIYK